MSKNDDMIKLVRLFEGKQFAGEPEQKPGDQVRGTDKAVTKGKQHPFHNRLVGEEISLEDKLSKRYQDMKDVQAKEKEQNKKEELDEQGITEGLEKFSPEDIKIAINFNSRDPVVGLGKIWEIVQDGKIRFNLSNGHRDSLNKLLSKPIASKEDWNLLKKQIKTAIAGQQGVEEASLATMRDYYAGDTDARDKTKLGQMRDYFSKVDPRLASASQKFPAQGRQNSYGTSHVRTVREQDPAVDEGFLDNPGQEDSPVSQAITRRILLQRTDLLSKYGPEKVMAAIDEVADFVGDVEEIGSSDVSGWIRHVEQMLGNMNEQGVGEAAPALVKGAAGLAMGGIAAAGAPALVGILGPLLGIPFAAYGAYTAAKLGMKGVEKLWDMAAEKLGGEDQVAQYTNAKIAKLPPDQAQAAAQVVKSVAESRRARGGTELAEVSNPTDKITLDVPLMIRIMEYAREDAQDDVDLHNVAEQLVRLSGMGKTLGMKDYDGIVGVTTEQKLSELGAVPPTPPTPPQGTATPTSGSVSPDEQTALNKIQTNPAMKQQFDKLMTQATPGAANKPAVLDPEQADALDKIKTNAGLKSQYDQLIKQANPTATP